MSVELLISCMHQKDFSVAEQMNIQSRALMINQCDTEGMDETEINGYPVRMISTAERGLSRSRNMAIRNAAADFCLICDDDEKLYDTYVQTIENAYERIPDADIIAFRMANQRSRLKQEEQLLNKYTCMRISSWQITFRVDSIRAKGLYFDPYMGAGSGNGAGEEVKFLRDCIGRGMKVYYVPEDIGEVNNTYYETGEAQGTWFKGFDRDFFYQRGITNRYMLGLPVSVLYAFYYTIVKRNEYGKYMKPADALKYTLQGIINNDIQKQKEAEKGGKNEA